METPIRKKTFTTENVIDLSFEKTTIVNMHHDTIDDSVICLQKAKKHKGIQCIKWSIDEKKYSFEKKYNIE